MKYAYASGSDSEDDPGVEETTSEAPPRPTEHTQVPSTRKKTSKSNARPKLVPWESVESKIKATYVPKKLGFVEHVRGADFESLQTCLYSMLFLGLTANLVVSPFPWLVTA